MAFALRRLAASPALRSPAIRSAAPQVARSVRCFSSAGKLSKILEAEAKHEKDQYEEPPLVKDFLSKSPFKFSMIGGDVNMSLAREHGGKKLTVDWQLTSPFGDDAMEENEQDDSAPPTDFTFSVESMSGDEGLIFYCSTSSGDGDRFVIGNVRQFSSKEEKDSNTAYNGPDFEDLDEKLQESFLEYLKDSGLTDELCDFIDATALDKEQVEYMRWLENSKLFLAA